jgi:hypothetical protein
VRYYKILKDGYIISVATGLCTQGVEITSDEYFKILELLKTAPFPQIGYIYKLNCDLQWECIEVEIPNESEYVSIVERIGRLEEQTNANSTEITHVQEALCEIYESII